MKHFFEKIIFYTEQSIQSQNFRTSGSKMPRPDLRFGFLVQNGASEHNFRTVLYYTIPNKPNRVRIGEIGGLHKFHKYNLT